VADGRAAAALPAHRGRGGGVLSRRRGPDHLPGIVDAHAHLQHARFDADRDEVLARAIDAGIERILVPGWDEASSEAALELAAAHPGLVQAAVGVHPHHAAQPDEAGWARLEALAADARCSAVGEIGLDHFRNLAPPVVQAAAFARQLELAARLDRPVVVHDREAHAPIQTALTAWQGLPNATVRGVLHAFSGDAPMALRLAGAGFLVSFALPVSFGSARAPRDAARQLEPDRFLVETDAPYLGPDRDRRNEPTTVLRVVAELARLRDVGPDAIAGAARRAYDLLVAPPAVARKES
jgi:TatD DNase family protein